MTPSRRTSLLALAGAVVVGALTALQARINGQLGVALGDGLVAAVISFGSGLALVGLLSAVTPAGRRGVCRLVRGLHDRDVPAWMLLGGLAGALTVATQGLAVGIIGVSLFTVGVVAGQTVNGLVLDRVGYGPAGVVAITPGRLLGGALSLVAVGISLLSDTATGVPWWMLLLPFLAGAGIAWQQATNGRLRARVHSALTATLVNFAGGTAALAVAAAISITVAGPPTAYPAEPGLYTGGAIGVAYIFLTAALVGYTGVLLFGLGAVVGQLVASVLLDALWPSAASPPLGQALAMVAVALTSVVVAAARRPRRAR